MKQYGHNVMANIMGDVGDDNSDFRTRNKISNSHLMYFIIVSIIALININNIYINYGFRCFDAAPFANSRGSLRQLSRLIV